MYYRLNVFTIHMLPLSERQDDIPLLVDSFIKKYKQIMGKENIGIDKSVIDSFQRYSWPGNIRELQNIVERMLHFGQSNVMIKNFIPEEIRKVSSVNHSLEQILTRKEFEREQIIKMIHLNVKKTDIARKMGISRPTLYRKLKEYKIS